METSTCIHTPDSIKQIAVFSTALDQEQVLFVNALNKASEIISTAQPQLVGYRCLDTDPVTSLTTEHILELCNDNLAAIGTFLQRIPIYSTALFTHECVIDGDYKCVDTFFGVIRIARKTEHVAADYSLNPSSPSFTILGNLVAKETYEAFINFVQAAAHRLSDSPSKTLELQQNEIENLIASAYGKFESSWPTEIAHQLINVRWPKLIGHISEIILPEDRMQIPVFIKGYDDPRKNLIAQRILWGDRAIYTCSLFCCSSISYEPSVAGESTNTRIISEITFVYAGANLVARKETGRDRAPSCEIGGLPVSADNFDKLIRKLKAEYWRLAYQRLGKYLKGKTEPNDTDTLMLQALAYSCNMNRPYEGAANALPDQTRAWLYNLVLPNLMAKAQQSSSGWITCKADTDKKLVDPSFALSAYDLLAFRSGVLVGIPLETKYTDDGAEGVLEFQLQPGMVVIEVAEGVEKEVESYARAIRVHYCERLDSPVAKITDDDEKRNYQAKLIVDPNQQQLILGFWIQHFGSAVVKFIQVTLPAQASHQELILRGKEQNHSIQLRYVEENDGGQDGGRQRRLSFVAEFPVMQVGILTWGVSRADAIPHPCYQLIDRANFEAA